MTRDMRPIDTNPAPSGSGAGQPRQHADVEGPPPGVHAMALFRWMLIIVMAVVAALSVTYSFGLLSSGPAGASSVQYYCPMHPQVVQDHPGECPICSMTLVKKEGGSTKTPRERAASGSERNQHRDEGAAHDGHRHDPADAYYCPMHPEETGADANARCPICAMKLEERPAGTPPSTSRGSPEAMPDVPGKDAASMPMGVPGLVPVEIRMDRVQAIGVRTAAATAEELTAELRTVGFVSADEGRLARVHTRFSGWIDQLEVSETGQKVARGQVLASLYNLELLPAQQEFLAARRWNSNAPALEPQATASTIGRSMEADARARLELFGLSPTEIDRVAETGNPTRTVAVTAPIGGHVITKTAVRGAFVQPGTELFEIADLSRVWVLADIYEYELGRVRVGQVVDVHVEAHSNERFSGKIAFIYPTVDASTRTLRVRVELDNKGLKLRPGMYGNVVIHLDAARGVVIPAEALVDTGEYQYVFIAKDGGHFEPRRVRVGARAQDKVQILEGVAPGDVVVTTANFMIDSESRLRATIEGTPEPGMAPAAAASACDADFDRAKFPEKYAECRECERVHRGMGTMEEDCKHAIVRPWR